MSVPARVGVATLGVSDVARATEFYRSLGWRLAKTSVPGVVSYFHTSGSMLSLVAENDLTVDAGLPPRASSYIPDGTRSAMLSIVVAGAAEVDSTLRSVVQAGATLVSAGKPAETGAYRGYFTDPDGHLWEVTYHPEWEQS
ncbi:VOC family protein [Actinoplanes sp. N902-109]|uniref:VOC family protein n=1 Tax=Actinoplanes sp. (strain N902-109) TaxID=649831 RepID=UPI0003295B32|nr:VOC family protein [Actinoplanes sp. N902-109]AGL15347.1 glyoxalase/bleomycin resistance protein/dioxygenase [Actinoplanes sp. N902-109]